MSEKISLFVPGRLCLFGEHSDWAGNYMMQNSEIVEGQAIVTGINLGIYAEAEKSDVFYIESFNQNGEKVFFESSMNYKELRSKASSCNLFSYCCGVAAYMVENYHIGGIKLIVTKNTLPMKKGLSSSAAICCLVAKAFNKLYNLNISTRGIMQIAYRGELMTGSRCGRLDQACAYGERPVLMHFTCNDEIDVEKISVGKNLYWVIADMKAAKDTKKILANVHRAYPFATTEKEKKVQDALGKDNHLIIARAKQAIQEGNAIEIGNIMKEAQLIFDEKVAPLCMEELEAPVLHSLLNDEYINELTFGGKGVGSQGDGTIQFIAKNKKCQKLLVDYLNDTLHMDAFPFMLNAGGKIKKAIIPIAGFGSRMFPESFFVKKAFLPIMCKDNVIKPVILILLEELFDAEIEDVFLIIGENELDEYKKKFRIMFEDGLQNKLTESQMKTYNFIKTIENHIHFIVQKEKKGFGHAVFQAYKYLNKEPVLLLLGDFIYCSNLDISCMRQTINAYNKAGGKTIVSLKEIDIKDTNKYGVVHGKASYEYPYIYNLDMMVEKPDSEYAENYLLMDNKCYATFGQYVLTDKVFELLEQQIIEAEINDDKNEIDLTNALNILSKNGELVGVTIDGKSFDVGIPSFYYKTFYEFYKG